VLAPLSVLAGVAGELRAIVGEPPIKIDQGDLGEENGGQQREPDVEDEVELRLVQSHSGR
jgi:hypothetical protein